jgi:multidrug resistance efflux pump
VEGPEASHEITTHRENTDINGLAQTNGKVATAAALSQLVEPPTPQTPKRSKRKLLIVLAMVVGLILVIGGGLYWQYTSQFVSTDNAEVDGDKIDINAPDTGTVSDWILTQGSTVTTNEVVGRIRIGTTNGAQQVIRAPGNGTVAVFSVVNGTYVNSGATLATAYNLSDIYVTARVDESDIADVHVGALVDMDVDAFPGVPVQGQVEEVQGSAAGAFSLFPQDNSSGNFQKVSQVIPVKIAILNSGGVRLAPGENVTVHIHKSP